MKFVPIPAEAECPALRACGRGCVLLRSLALVGALYEHPLVLVAALGAIGVAAGAPGWAARCWAPCGWRCPSPSSWPDQPARLPGGRHAADPRRRAVRPPLRRDARGDGGRCARRPARAWCIIVALWLMSVAVDPDALLRLLRRFSYRSALTASLATRLVPVLARDATRMSDAARCRPGPRPRWRWLARARSRGRSTAAVDVAAALELRGYSLAGRPARRAAVVAPRHPRSPRRRC